MSATPSARARVVPAPAGPALAALLAGLLPAGSLRRRLASGAGWSVAGSGASQALALAAGTLAARVLGPGEYGAVVVVLGTSTVLAEVAGGGLAVAATRHVAELRDADPGRAARLATGAVALAAAAGAVLGLLQLALAPWLAGSVLGAPSLAPLLALAAPLTLAASACAAQAGVLGGLEDFRGLAVASGARGLATVGAVVPGALAAGPAGAVAGHLAATVACALFQRRAVRAGAARRAAPSALPRASDLRDLARVGVPAVVAGLVLAVSTWASTALLARESLPEAGVLGVARQWQAVVLFLAGAVSGIALPVVASALPGRDPAALRRALRVSFAASTGLALLVAVPVAALAPLLLSLSGPAFAGRSGVLVLACGAAVLLAANMAAGQAIWALGAHRSGVALAALRGALLVGLSAWLAPRGAGGVAFAWLASAAVLAAVQVPFVAWLLARTAAEWRAG